MSTGVASAAAAARMPVLRAAPSSLTLKRACRVVCARVPSPSAQCCMRVASAHGRMHASARRSMRASRSIARSVLQIEHSSIDHAIFSCDQIRLRVQSDVKFGCSIRWSNKRRSITELNSDSRPQLFLVKHTRRLASRTILFCGLAPAGNSVHAAASTLVCKRTRQVETVQQGLSSCTLPRLLNAGLAPAFAHSRGLSLRVSRLDVAPVPRRSRRHLLQSSALRPDHRSAHARVLAPSDTRRPGFISVSGFRPERSALHSDLRLKRFSGSVAAPVLPHAPMNSPAASRAGFPSQPSAS